MASARKVWLGTWAGLRRWFYAEDVEPQQQTLVAGLRQFWLVIAGIPVIGGTVIGVIGNVAGWW